MANVERVVSLRWRDNGNPPALGSNLANSGGSSCGDPTEFWGQSYGDLDSALLPAPVAAGGSGIWRRRGGRSVELNTSRPSNCSGDTAVIPVRTRYTFFDAGGAADKVRVERRWSFSSNSPAYANTHGLRAYFHLSNASYSQAVHPNSAGTRSSPRARRAGVRDRRSPSTRSPPGGGWDAPAGPRRAQTAGVVDAPDTSRRAR